MTVPPSLTKTAKAAANCQLDVTYEVVVTNNSQFDTETLNSQGLNDDKFGDITQVHAAGTFAQVVSTNCGTATNANPPGPGILPATINPSASYTCRFTGRITSTSCAIRHTDTVTGSLTDDDAVSSTPSDSAQVNVDVTFP